MYLFERKQIVPTSIEACWDFFSDPKQLAAITPDSLNFEIIRGAETRMYPGQLIEYYVRPLAGIKLRWMTEITQVKDHRFFIDEQRFGPYRFWHHKHFFKEVPEGVEMIDRIHYKLPLEPFSKIIHPFLVRPRLEEIFEYRTEVISEIFGKPIPVSEAV